MANFPSGWHLPPLGLVPEMCRILFWRVLRGPRVLYRSSLPYRLLLRGALNDHIAFYPHDALPRKLEDADALLHGRFCFHGETVEARDGSIFDETPPSPQWAEALHGFSWLPPLSTAGGEPSRVLASNLIGQWIKRNARYAEPACDAQVLARRLIHFFAHSRILLANSDLMWRSRAFVSLRDQVGLMTRIASEAPPGLPRFEAAVALALSGSCLADGAGRLASGLQHLEAEITAQILPDGGHVSRSPETLLQCYRLVTMLTDSLSAINQPVTQEIRSALDRMAPMIRFFRHGDGALALFNGGRECDAKMIAGLLARDEVRGLPFAFAPHSGYQRILSGRTILIQECGAPPQGAFSVDAHAAPLAFELSAGPQRIVVNVGAARGARQTGWSTALRGTAAHSTLTLNDMSAGLFLISGWARDLLGPRLLGGFTQIEARRVETADGCLLEASHDGYVADYGIRHERLLTLAPKGNLLTGVDRLVPQGKTRGRSIPFAIRFHIHPDVRVSPSQGGDILLKLPKGEGWRFRCGTQATIEESVYLGGDTLRRAEQLVVQGAVKDQTVEVGWLFEQIGKA